MNLKCRLGFHNYQDIGVQYAKNIVGGFSMIQLMRNVEKCDRCDKVYYQAFDISTNAHLDDSLNWQPNLATLKVKSLL